jgi:hypothetical protein
VRQRGRLQRRGGRSVAEARAFSSDAAAHPDGASEPPLSTELPHVGDRPEARVLRDA